jgi:hypothetical protein
METILCDFCKKEVVKVKSRGNYKNSFCNKRCHADYKIANFKTCVVDSCTSRSLCKRLCQKHYDIFRNTEERKTYKNEKQKEWMLKYKEILKQDEQLNLRFKEKCKTATRKYKTKNSEKVKEKDREAHRTPKRRFGQAKRGANKRGFEFTLNLKEYSSLTQSNLKCYYNCGNFVPMSGIGLDRLDSSRGYVLNNVVPCCGICNATKNSMLSSQEMLEVVKLLKILRGTDYIWNGKSTTHTKLARHSIESNVEYAEAPKKDTKSND